jgi:hypothetical protein
MKTNSRSALWSLVVGLLIGCGGAEPQSAAPAAPAATSMTSAAASAAPAAPPASDNLEPDPFKPVDTVADASGRLSFPSPSIANHPQHVPLYMQVPKGTRAHAEATHVLITGNPHFAVSVNPDLQSTETFVEEMKGTIKNLKVVEKGDDVLVYSGIETRKKDDGSGEEYTRGGVHFLVTKGGLGAGFQCHDWATVDLTKKDVDAMVKACQSLSLD